MTMMRCALETDRCRLVGQELGRGGTKAAALNDVRRPPRMHRKLLLLLSGGPGMCMGCCCAQVLFASTFFVCRIVIGPFLTYYTLASPSSVGLVKVGPALQVAACRVL